MTDDIDPEMARWVNAETERVERQGWVPGSLRENEILATWLRVRPTIFARLQAAGPDIAAKTVFVLDQKRREAEKQYIQGGWWPPM